MSRGPIRRREDLDALPKEDPFVFQDHLPAVSGGLVRYWKDRASSNGWEQSARMDRQGEVCGS
jgi:hypothetical protein